MKDVDQPTTWLFILHEMNLVQLYVCPYFFKLLEPASLVQKMYKEYTWMGFTFVDLPSLSYHSYILFLYFWYAIPKQYSEVR